MIGTAQHGRLPEASNSRRRRGHQWIAQLAVLAGVASAALAFASSASAAYESKINTTSALTFCAGTTTLCRSSEGSVAAGTDVHMVCWVNPVSDLSHRYFYIQVS